MLALDGGNALSLLWDLDAVTENDQATIDANEIGFEFLDNEIAPSPNEFFKIDRIG